MQMVKGGDRTGQRWQYDDDNQYFTHDGSIRATSHERYESTHF
jgi:hypothetical protein